MSARFLPVILIFLSATPFALPAAAADIAAGRQVYQHNCASCHGRAGNGGMAGTPDLRRPGGVLSQPDSVLLDRIEHGYRSAGSPLAMPPKGGNPSLTGEDMRNVLAYMRDTFGTQSGSIVPGEAPPPAGENNGASAPAGRGMMGRGMMGGGMMRR